MNLQLPYIPERDKKPREKGLTMVMDKGLSVRQVEDFIETCSEYTDFLKFGFGTSLVTTKLNEKIALYKKAGIIPYFGGTLLEAFIIRGKFDEFRKFIDSCKIEVVEVSDGSMAMEMDEKLGYIQKLSKDFTVISEVGSKIKGVYLSTEKWIIMMQEELKAGSKKVIAEARESGTVGIYNDDGSANVDLVNDISKKINKDDIIWEAPSGKQQVWFIKMQGSDVNLGNIAPDLVIPLECLRLGLRGDTFLDFLPKDIIKGREPKK